MKILPEITFKELEVATFLYSHFFKYDQSYKHLSSKKLDLSVQDDLDCIIQFLRDWGCRQFKRDDQMLSTSSLKNWYSEFEKELPDTNSHLLQLSTAKIKSFEHIFNELLKSRACNKIINSKEISNCFGPVGTAKTLFALRSNIFAPWDNIIIDELGISPDGSGYCNYLIEIKKQLTCLKNECNTKKIGFTKLPEMLNRNYSSLPKLIDEYYMIKYTRGCNPKELIEIINKAEPTNIY